METLTRWLGELQGGELLAALRFPLDPDKRIFGWYLLTASVIAVAVYWHAGHGRGRSVRGLGRYLFNPRIWWHRSARLDYQVMLVNPAVSALLNAAGLVSMAAVAIAIADVMDDWLGPAEPQWPPAAVTAALTLALFVADDFTRYLLHWLLHRVPALWALHRLHHSAEVLTPVTVYRIHPLESLLYTVRMTLTQGCVVGLFFYGFGLRLGAWDIAGANLFTFAFNLAGANLRHSHVRLSYGRWLERLFISPAQHQIHHSNRPEHFDRNFGSFLAVWDWLFGTLTLAHGQRRHGFGLGPRGRRRTYETLWQAYWWPVAEAAGTLAGGWSRRRHRAQAPPLSTGPVHSGAGPDITIDSHSHYR